LLHLELSGPLSARLWQSRQRLSHAYEKAWHCNARETQLLVTRSSNRQAASRPKVIFKDRFGSCKPLRRTAKNAPSVSPRHCSVGSESKLNRRDRINYPKHAPMSLRHTYPLCQLLFIARASCQLDRNGLADLARACKASAQGRGSVHSGAEQPLARQPKAGSYKVQVCVLRASACAPDRFSGPCGSV
jgi:hypothetical protein